MDGANAGKEDVQRIRKLRPWAVSLWMSNDRENYERYRDLARSVVTECTGEVQEFLSRKTKAVALAEALQDDFQEFSPFRREASVYADLMNAALEEVDWYELAEDLLHDIGEG